MPRARRSPSCSARRARKPPTQGRPACVVLAGARPVSWVSLAVELQRDWARLETVQQVVQIVLTERLLKEE